MIKYIILGLNNPDIYSNSADIRYFTGTDFSNNIKFAFTYNQRAEAEDYIKKNFKNVCCMTYGVDENELK